MKQLKVLVVACLLFTGTAMAQTKIGYIKIDQVVGLMPETAKLDSLIGIYNRDSVQAEYVNLLSIYQFKDSIYNDSVRTKKAVRDQIGQELQGLQYQLQNWNSISQQAIEAKQNQLLAPLYTQVYNALKTVAKEKGYTHVYDKSVMLIAPDGDDLFPAVAAKLKLKIPTGQAGMPRQ